MAVSFQELEKALESLKEAIQFTEVAKDPQFRMFRDSAIQRFEFCIELSWKVSAKALGSTSAAAKPVIREMARDGLIGDPDLWFGFIDARNKTSHTYSDDVATEVYLVAKKFLPHGEELCKKIKKI